jgi:hypothetical protein
MGALLGPGELCVLPSGFAQDIFWATLLGRWRRRLLPVCRCFPYPLCCPLQFRSEQLRAAVCGAGQGQGVTCPSPLQPTEATACTFRRLWHTAAVRRSRGRHPSAGAALPCAHVRCVLCRTCHMRVCLCARGMRTGRLLAPPRTRLSPGRPLAPLRSRRRSRAQAARGPSALLFSRAGSAHYAHPQSGCIFLSALLPPCDHP